MTLRKLNERRRLRDDEFIDELCKAANMERL
jgi:hypothetical protein